MTIINVSQNRLVQIGYEGEDKVTILRFGYSKKWLENGEGIFTVRVLRNGENQAYNAQSIKDDRENYTIDMTVTDVELSIQGYGEMQLVYTGADFVKKSPVYKYYVSRSIDEAVDPPESDVYTQIIENLADLRVDLNELSDMVSEVNEDIGDLTELTTANKFNIVESINEVNVKKANTQDVADTVHDLETDIGTLKIDVQSKADTQTVSALSDAVNGLDGDVRDLQTAVQTKADTATMTTLSDTVTGLQTSKADKTYVDTRFAEKASTQTVSDLANDVSDLQIELAEKVNDVQINGLSVMSDGVANVPIASSSNLGVSKCSSSFGINARADGYLNIVSANSTAIKNGDAIYLPVTTTCQHESAFYGLAKVAGHDEKDSTLAVGEYTDEAKIAIQNMFDVPSTATVSTLSDAVQDLDSDVQGLQTIVQSKADTSTVTELSGTVSGLQTVVQSKADAQMVSDLSDTVTSLQTDKADKSYVDTELASKASTAVATASSDGLMSAQDKTKLDGLNNGISDVRVNGTSVVTDGVAEIPVATDTIEGVVRASGAYGIRRWSNTNSLLVINAAISDFIKNPSKYGTADFRPITPCRQHESTFYGLAKAAGHDEKDSTLPVGTYSEEAKSAIRTMLGLQDVYEDYSSALTALGVIE